MFLCDEGEYHGNNPEMSKLLHKAVRQKNESAYAVYQQHLANRPVNVSTEDIIVSPFTDLTDGAEIKEVLF